MTNSYVSNASAQRVRISSLANMLNWLMIPLSVLLIIMVAGDIGTLPARQWLTLLVFALGPGSGLVQFLKLPTAAMQLGILLALSAAIDLILGQGLLYVGNINGTAAACLLAAITCIRPLRFTTNGKTAS